MPAQVKKDPRIDAYISKAPDFAKPILQHLRALVHKGCPSVEETMKWSRPHFMHKGLLCGMSAFKHHCAFGFWMGKMVLGEKGVCSADGEGMGHFGKLVSLKDLPTDKEMLAYIQKAAALNESGVKRPVPTRTVRKKELTVPDYVVAALKKNPKARATFEAFSYSHKKEYVEWITEAKREETRQNRIATMLAWLTEGKSRNWKYANC